MSLDKSLSHCALCEQHTLCSNIFIALRILETEMRYCKAPQLVYRFGELNNEIADLGFHYPSELDTCRLRKNPMLAESVLQRLEHLLADVQAQLPPGTAAFV